MLVLCKHCPAKIKIADSAFDRGIPTVVCPICKKQFKPDAPKPPVSPDTEKPTKPLFDEEVGWLVVHDDQTRQQTLSLKPGRQTVGRISSIADKKADVMIDSDDEYMSRQHFIINIERKSSGGYNYYLSDNSKNRTLINKKAMRKGDEYILKDGDIIQAGLTNIVFKTNNQVKNTKEATNAVTSQPKQKTEIVFDF